MCFTPSVRLSAFELNLTIPTLNDGPRHLGRNVKFRHQSLWRESPNSFLRYQVVF